MQNFGLEGNAETYLHGTILPDYTIIRFNSKNRTKLKMTPTFVHPIFSPETTRRVPDVAWEQNFVNTISW